MDRLQCARQTDSNSIGRSRRRGFTLVELLVVIGIIAVLISLLLPVLSRAREASNKIKCAANLRSIGQAATIFAASHKGWFPRGFVQGNGCTMAWAWLYGDAKYDAAQSSGFMQPYKDSPTEEHFQQTYGLSLTVWKAYGLGIGPLPDTAPAPGQSIPLDERQLGVLSCPSADSGTDQELLTTSNTNWPGPVVHGSYCYMGGYPAGPAINAGDNNVHADGSYTEHNSITISVGGHFINSKLLPPAIATNESNSARRILAIDRVNIANYSGPLDCITNHGVRYKAKNRNSDFMPKFVNVLFGDGHVDGLIGTDHFKTDWLNLSNANSRHAADDYTFWWGPIPKPQG